MKHLFIIHSHTTFLTALGTIHYLNVSEKDCIMLFSRNYTNDVVKHNCNVIDFNAITNFCKTNMFKTHKMRTIALKLIDDFVNDNICDKYILYAPHFSLCTAQALYTNVNCIKGSYIQEGGIPYKTAYKTNNTWRENIYYFLLNRCYYRTKRVWRPSYWYLEGTLNKQFTIDSFSISDTFFKYLPSINHIIKWPSIDLGLNINTKANFFIFDGFVKNGMCEKKLYFNCCARIIQDCAYDFNYIKFHPNQDVEERNFIISVFEKERYKYEILNDTIPFELILSSYSNLTVTGFGSSILYFARDKGHKVLCREKWLDDSVLYTRYRNKFGIENSII